MHNTSSKKKFITLYLCNWFRNLTPLDLLPPYSFVHMVDLPGVHVIYHVLHLIDLLFLSGVQLPDCNNDCYQLLQVVIPLNKSILRGWRYFSHLRAGLLHLLSYQMAEGLISIYL